jgi:trehalose/maltose hydrolase-like predicted phosphorylase
MGACETLGRVRRPVESVPPPGLDRRFEAIVFDWDGTAVADRRVDATRLRALLVALSAVGMDLVVVSGTDLTNVDGQLRARPAGPGGLFLCLGRGTEAYAVDWCGPRVLERRTPTIDEDDRLSAAARLAASRLADRGLACRIIDRPGRRKLDLLPVAGWSDPPKAEIGALLGAVERHLRAAGLGSLSDAADIVRAAAVEVGLRDVRLTSDAKHIEIGLTDKSDSGRWAFRTLWDRGIGPGLVLVVGDEFGTLGGLPGSDSRLLIPGTERATVMSVGVEPEGVPVGIIHWPGGPDAFLDVLADQLRRRTERAIPDIDVDPDWIYRTRGSGEDERAQESLSGIGDGRFGSAGAPIDDAPGTMPRVLAAGVYVRTGSASTLLQAPLWDRSGLTLRHAAGLCRTLDLRTGVLLEDRTDGRLRRRAVRFASLPRPGAFAMRVGGPARLMPEGPALVAPPGVAAREQVIEGRRCLSVTGDPGGIVAAAREYRTADEHGWRADRLAAFVANPDRMPSGTDAIRALKAVEEAGFDRLLVEQRAAWAARWADADIRIDGDDELQRAVRFALFHLMASVPDVGEALVGARGISGFAYRGHVFWDSDVFVLPFLAAAHPAAARAMLEYRVRRTAAATAAAAAMGREGARFPWESAWTGFDVTPRSFRDHAGQLVQIRTGDLEEHIVADVAWSALTYLAWTGDHRFADDAAGVLLAETARYWSSRITLGEDGRAHILGVTGPDEYHEAIDDNAFTNVMARWNLRQAARRGGAPVAERARWRWLADRLVDGYDQRTKLYEQFNGFWKLEPLLISRLTRRPVAADVLLGRERVSRAQVVKQADVLMLHYMVPEATHSGSLGPNLAYYEPRTAHGSSLSPGVHAALLARAGLLIPAMETLRLASRLDLDDVTRTTAGGLHLAAMGSVWQAIVWGIAGMRPTRSALLVDPHLPPGWTGLEIPVRYRGARIRIRIEPGSAAIETDRATSIRLRGGSRRMIAPGTTHLTLSDTDGREDVP